MLSAARRARCARRCRGACCTHTAVNPSHLIWATRGGHCEPNPPPYSYNTSATPAPRPPHRQCSARDERGVIINRCNPACHRLPSPSNGASRHPLYQVPVRFTVDPIRPAWHTPIPETSNPSSRHRQCTTHRHRFSAACIPAPTPRPCPASPYPSTPPTSSRTRSCLPSTCRPDSPSKTSRSSFRARPTFPRNRSSCT
ncbi:uncharacterized protein BDZ99DRAFT_99110 [Mytilinidion resinicola]|uniref:Uncharacterized protein n=1 Tax=Mytilinidion resinicola TaxID=574789 RepID=A0A6A6YB19_9PEZI|nr:uncharacterized protein BDZ99DRAFT_99110 [Mytilinidion resinicola]KAF2805819.1 hypothetical protein BDZ99DRAFT_99110 [Mytilinidion resinicola]